jgi:hypothetical protein
MSEYKTFEDILVVVRGFENGTIPRDKWRHAEHLTVALYYVSNHDFDSALTKMRHGIFNLLKSFKVDFIKEMPYHETLTVFWIKTVYDFNNSKKDAPILAVCNELIEKFDKNYPFQFYSRERLFSEEARAGFVEADLQKFSAMN